MNFYRVYFFDDHMNVVEYLDRLLPVEQGKPHEWAEHHVQEHGYYTYAIGALR